MLMAQEYIPVCPRRSRQCKEARENGFAASPPNISTGGDRVIATIAVVVVRNAPQEVEPIVGGMGAAIVVWRAVASCVLYAEVSLRYARC